MNKEKRLNELYETCFRLLREEKIPVSKKIKSVSINRRAAARFGKCIKEGDGYRIEISEKLLEPESGGKGAETVMLHEMLHTCPGCMNHGKTWKHYAAKLNSKYGYSITVRASYESLGLPSPESRESVKYVIVCTCCGAAFPRRRKCSLVEHVDRYRCGKCGGTLEIQ